MSNEELVKKEKLLDNLDKIAFTLDKAYLEHLHESKVIPFKEIDEQDKITYSANIRSLRVKSWVYDREENIINCFKNALSVFSGSNNSVAMVIKRTSSNVEIYFVTQNTGEGHNEDSTNDIHLLNDSLCGNFPGSNIEVIEPTKTEAVMKEVLDFNNYCSISSLCNVPSDKSDEYVSQGIDKLLNGIVPRTDEENYVLLILANSLNKETIRQILTGYEDIATALTPYSGYQFQHGVNETKTTSEMETLSHSEGISTTITKTHSLHLGISHTEGGEDTSNTISAGYGYSRSKGKTISSIDTQSKGITESLSLGTSDSTTYTYKSFVISDLIKKLEKTIDRIQTSQSNGLWRCASYVLAKDSKTSKNVANFLRSLTQGNESFCEPGFIETWSYQNTNGVTPFGEIREYLSHFSHPVFMFEDSIAVTPTTYVSTTELAKLFAFPKNSVQGVPVINCARFGREPHFSKETTESIDIGCAYHMRTPEKYNKIKLDSSELTAHALITGSTGSGKSNTVYKLLHELCFQKSSKVNFLVIEPAKGEYKKIFGGQEGVSVYGTNFKMAPLLRLNPFSFPEEIHVLEHIDRLVEIFNACWPMYAAMPAVLKDAIEASYESCGWNLTHSVCKPKSFPTFETLLEKLPKIINNSAYSSDAKSDYIGALVTRVKSLTNGINGQIFCLGNELSFEELFDKNVIVDISRVGSIETKSLLMGILMIKLQEYRMSKAEETNSELRHITVLEEAHNILRRTSFEQSQDSSNLQGKSVEMLSNAIAEMRTYGEGFFIVDQAPGLLDMSVIRNTNTKIIMRLPDESDRILVGRSAGLNDEQITELSKLDCGVAAIFQNHWTDAVLCQVDKFDEAKPLKYSYENKDILSINRFINNIFNVNDNYEIDKEDVDILRNWITELKCSKETKDILLKTLTGKTLSLQDKTIVAYNLFNGKKIAKILVEEEDVAIGINLVDNFIKSTIVELDDSLVEDIRKLIMDSIFEMLPNGLLTQKYKEFANERRNIL